MFCPVYSGYLEASSLSYFKLRRVPGLLVRRYRAPLFHHGGCIKADYQFLLPTYKGTDSAIFNVVMRLQASGYFVKLRNMN